MKLKKKKDFLPKPEVDKKTPVETPKKEEKEVKKAPTQPVDLTPVEEYLEGIRYDTH